MMTADTDTTPEPDGGYYRVLVRSGAKRRDKLWRTYSTRMEAQAVVVRLRALGLDARAEFIGDDPAAA